MYQSHVHDIEELLYIWHGLQQSAVDEVQLNACVRSKAGHFEL